MVPFPGSISSLFLLTTSLRCFSAKWTWKRHKLTLHRPQKCHTNFFVMSQKACNRHNTCLTSWSSSRSGLAGSSRSPLVVGLVGILGECGDCERGFERMLDNLSRKSSLKERARRASLPPPRIDLPPLECGGGGLPPGSASATPRKVALLERDVKKGTHAFLSIGALWHGGREQVVRHDQKHRRRRSLKGLAMRIFFSLPAGVFKERWVMCLCREWKWNHLAADASTSSESFPPAKNHSMVYWCEKPKHFGINWREIRQECETCCICVWNIRCARFI